MLEWLIIGGGMHAVFHARGLIRKGYRPEDIRIVDPYPQLMQHWFAQCRRCGMQYMRSSSSHCLDTDFRHLRRYAAAHGYGKDHFLQPYSRPSLDLFQQYSKDCIRESQLEDIHLNALAHPPVRRDAESGVFRVHTAQATAGKQPSIRHLDTRRILFAVGRSDPGLPAWVTNLPEDRYWHVLNPARGMEIHEIPTGENIAVVGSGITGISTAIARAEQLIREGNQPAVVHVLSVTPPYSCLFDFDPGYVGPKYLTGYTGAAAAQRLLSLDQSRNRGSVPNELLQRFLELQKEGRIQLHETAVNSMAAVAGYDRVLFATGLPHTLPDIVKNTAELLKLPLTEPTAQGVPVTDESCCWGEGIFVSGAAASFSIGPAAPNIIGAHLAFRRIHGMRTMRG